MPSARAEANLPAAILCSGKHRGVIQRSAKHQAVILREAKRSRRIHPGRDLGARVCA